MCKNQIRTAPNMRLLELSSPFRQSILHMNYKIGLLPCLLAISLIMLTDSASAQIKEHFQLLDENGDGLLTTNELALLSPLDSQHSGRVTLEAFTSAVQIRDIAHRAQWLIILDLRDGNKDGRLSGNELSGFEFADLDKNRRIDENEYLQGLREFYSSMIALSPKAIAEKATERFRMSDANEDGRLSGTEAVFLNSSDLSGDQRITRQEFIQAAILDVIAAGSNASDGAPPMQSNPITALVDAINRQDSQAVLALCRPEFQRIVNPFVLTYLLHQIMEGNGRLSTPRNVNVSEGTQPGTKNWLAEVSAERGTIALSTVVLDGKILGIAMNGPSIDNAIPKLLREMMTDIDGKLTTFANDCSPDCVRMIRRIQAAEDDVAIGMFHPEIPKQVSGETFAAVFEKLRAKVGKYQKIDLEEAGVDMDAAGTSGFITITHRVAGTAGTALVQQKLQIVGFRPYIVSIGIEPTADR